MDWAEKYRPTHLDEVVGNSTILRQMFEWAKSWSRESRPLLLYGKPGTGKTSSAHALANDLQWEVIELNASDQRTKAVIDRVAGTGSTTASLTGASRKLILLDEADNLQGTADRGGAKAILDLIRGSRQPIILIANDLYAIPGEIRSRCLPLQFKALQARSIAPRLRFICSSEGIRCSEEALHQIAESARGDMRSAVTMLYASAAGRQRLENGELRISNKDQRASVFDLISSLYGTTQGEDLLRVSYEVNETPDTLIQWVEGNLSGIHSVPELDEAYQPLSRADEYIGYTYRQQYHTLWRYATSVALLGVSRVTRGKGIHARISPPERWRRMGSYQKQKSVRSSMLRKVSSAVHMPRTTLQESYLTPFSILIDRDPLPYAREFRLDADELNLFLHDRARAQTVEKTLAAEEKEKEIRRDKETAAKGKKKVAPAPQKELPAPSEPDTSRMDEAPVEKADDRSQKTLFDGF
jgi:replication factor C large subunit